MHTIKKGPTVGCLYWLWALGDTRGKKNVEEGFAPIPPHVCAAAVFF